MAGPGKLRSKSLLPALLLLCWACYPSHYREARGKAPAELAKLRVGPGLTITAIDDERLEIPGLMLLPRRWDDFFLEPGSYAIRVLFSEGAALPERAVIDGEWSLVRVDLEPGQIRYLCAGAQFNRLGRVKAVKPYVAEFPDFDPARRWWQIHHVRPKTPPECR